MIYIDVETFSEADLKQVGAWRYANDPTTRLICLAYAIDDGEVVLWLPGQPKPQFPKGHKFVAHNSFFEWCVFEYVLKWHDVSGDPGDWIDTAALAAAVSLPRGLDGACKALGLPEELAKSKRGKTLIQRLCQPQGKLRKRNEDPALLAEFYEYNKQDVVAERELLRRLPPLTPLEQRVFKIDQRINLRGVAVDRALVSSAITLVEEIKTAVNAETAALTGGAVGSMTECASALELLAAHGCPMPDMRADTVVDTLLRVEKGSVAERLLQIRQLVSKSSTAKFRRFEQLSDLDSRLHGMFMYCAADTGRWGGKYVQGQNFPRPKVKNTDELAAQVKTCDASWVNFLYGNEMVALSSAIRSCVVPAPGKVLFVADYSAIEARVLAWLAGQDDIVQLFRKGADIYKYTAARIFNKRIEDVTADERQIGKVAVLALGYQGGVGAFHTMARAYGVIVSDEKAEDIKTEWRAANSHIRQFWYDVQNAAIRATQNVGDVYQVGYVAFKATKGRLWCRLPSGRKLCYHSPKVVPDTYVNKKGEIVDTEKLVYLGNDSFTHNWGEISTYGGSLVENITQAVARDLLAEALLRCEERGFPVVMHIHDEVIAECDPTLDFDAFIEALCELPAWAKGLPIKAEGKVLQRYRKM